jgi:hypothetical protein
MGKKATRLGEMGSHFVVALSLYNTFRRCFVLFFFFGFNTSEEQIDSHMFFFSNSVHSDWG